MKKNYVKPEASKFGLLPLMDNITSTPSDGEWSKGENDDPVNFDED